MFAELEAELSARFEAIIHRLDTIERQQVEIVSLLKQIQLSVGRRAPLKQCYTPVEVADILGKRSYTVREWCRNGRVNATKRSTGRGDALEWEISHEELERIRNHGLLPMRWH
jgi:hypothetical protein